MNVRRTRNDTHFYYCLYDSEQEIVDEWGNSSGQYIVTYADPVEMWANISPATGAAQTELFGTLDNYDKVIVTHDMDCPIDEHTVLFIDKEPEFTEAQNNEETAITVTGTTVTVPVYDYTVRRVAKSLNSISIAVSKVKVS